MSINNGTMNRIGAGGTLNTFGSVQTIDNTKIQELTEAIDQATESVQEAVQTVSDEVDNAKQEISAAASTVVQYDVPVICPNEDVGCVLIKNAELGDTETIEVLRPNGEVVRYKGKSIDFSQLGAKISEESDNIIEQKSDGIYVKDWRNSFSFDATTGALTITLS